MLITYCSTNEENFKTVEIYCNIYGFVTGFEWKHNTSSIYENRIDGKIEYDVSGILKWNIFGVTIYN